MEIKDILRKSLFKNRLQMEFTAYLSELMPERALISFTLYLISYLTNKSNIIGRL